MKRTIILVALALMVVAMLLSIVGCGNTTTEPTATAVPANTPAPQATEAATVAPAPTVAATKTGASNEYYIFVNALVQFPYFIDTYAGLDHAAKEFGVKTKVVGPTTLDMPAVVNAFEQAIAEKPTGILAVGWDVSMAPVVDKAIDQGIPVVCIDSDCAKSKRLAFVGTDNYNMGRLMAETMIKLTGGKGKVVPSLIPELDNLQQRLRGIKDVFKDNPGMELLEPVSDESDAQKGAQAIAAVIQGHPDLAGVLALDAGSGAGSYQAVKEAGKTGQIKIVALDREESVLNGIKEGVITASVVQKSGLMAYYAVQLMHELTQNPFSVVPDNKAAGVLPIPVNVDTGTILVTKDNVDLFYHKKTQ